MPSDNVTLLYTCRMMLMAALRLVGADDSSYELKPAVAAALALADAERRYLKGEPILGPGERPPPHADRSIHEMALYVAPTL